MKKKRHIIHTVLFLFLSVWSFCQTEAELKEEANKLFENEQYVKATPLFLQLISLNPEDGNYNYQYGTCLLFNSYKKIDALRYLDFAVKQSSPDPRALYFYGKALHLNFEFDKAIRYYQLYKTKRSKKDDRYNVEREIKMCYNGKRLLTTFTDIVVSEKKEIDKAKFFRLYNNMETVGGNILVSEDFQSKIDKKKGHIPIIHYPPDAKAIYYSSYGDSDETGKDLYVRRRLPNNKWGDPQKLPGMVNTNEDEDFPFMHSSGDFLFFSSKGHNSMGGYDIFMARLNRESNRFEKVENVDFAICSPDDDLFYVVDATFQNAYFASARQSQDGKLHVYNVRVARVPIREVIVMGDFLSEINPENKEMNVRVTSFTSNEEIGKIRSNKSGKYSFVFPKGGKYNYEVKIVGSEDIYKFVVELPFMDEFRPLKQKAIHKNIDGQEIVSIINLFDEKVEGAEAIMAEVIRKRSELEVNTDQFDLEELDAQQVRNEVLSELGFSDMSMREVSDQLEDLAITDQLKREKIKLIEGNLNSEIVDKAKEVQELNLRQNELIEQAGIESDAVKKHELLTDALTLELEIKQLSGEILGLEKLKNDSKETIDNSSTRDMASIEKQFNVLLEEGNESDALQLLAVNKNLIKKTKNESPDAIVKKLIEESISLTKEVDILRKEELDFEQSKDNLSKRNIILSNKLPSAKKKEAEAIRTEIAENKSEIALLDEVIKSTSDRITSKNEQLSIIDNNIASLQQAMLKDAGENISEQEVLASLKIGEDLSGENDVASFESQLIEIEKQHPELNPNYIPDLNAQVDTNNTAAHISQVESISEEINSDKESILADQSLSELEKEEALFKSNMDAVERLNSRIGSLDSKLVKNPSSKEISNELSSLNSIKKSLIEENIVHNERIEELKSSSSPTEVAITKEDVLSEVVNDYEEQIKTVENEESLSPKERIEAIISIDENTVSALEEELNVVRSEIQKDPSNSELNVKEEIISSLIEEKTQSISNKELELEALETTASVPTSEEILIEIASDYKQDVNRIENDNSLSEKEKLNELQSLDEKTLAKIIVNRNDTQNKLNNDSENIELKQRASVLDQLIEEKSRSIADRKEQIDATNETANTPTSEELMSDISKNYNRDVNRVISDNSLSNEDKRKELQSIDENVLAKIIVEKEKTQRKLASDPENNELKQKEEILDQMILEKESEIAERAQIISAETSKPIATADIKSELENELIAPFEKEITEIDNSDLSDTEKNIKLLEISHSLSNKLKDKKESLQEEIKNQPDNVSLKEQLTLVKEMDISNEKNMDTYLNAVEKSIDSEDLREAVSQVDKKYESDISEIIQDNSSDKFNQIAEREKELQGVLTKALADKEKALSRSWSVSAEMDKVTLMKAIEQSEQQEAAAINSFNEIVEQPKDESKLIESLRIEILGENVNSLEAVHTNLDDLKEQDQILKKYEDQLIEEIKLIKEEIELNGETVQLKNKQEALESELNTVQTKRRSVSVTIGELEQEFIQPVNPVSSIEEINNVNELNKELTSELLEINKNSDDNTIIEKAIKVNENSQKEIAILVEELNNAKSDEEKAFLLEKVKKRQELANSTMVRTIANDKREEIEKRENISLITQEELIRRKRTFSVQIGELTTEIIATDDDIEDAKKKEVPNLEIKKERLLSERALLEEELRTIEELILAFSPSSSVVNPEALNEAMTFNEERQLAGTEEYKEYFEEGSKAIDIEMRISLLEQELRKKIQETNLLISEKPSSENKSIIDVNVIRIKEINANIDQLKVELIQQKYTADELLTTSEKDAMKMQNLVARGIKPIKAIAVAAILQLPVDGFAINTNTESAYSESNPIPLDVESPSGLVYRVQIGAFAKPIPQNLYKEFNPVSGEKIAGTNVTRYMAGFFNSSEKVTEARSSIRGLGYSDAFVVAYCDGERVSFSKARELERAGTCIPKGTNELLVEVALKTAEKLGLPTTAEIPVVDESSYNQAPGASEADAIEMMQGLFFTVQIGVFNRPISDAVVYNLPELSTVRLPTGQIRYNTGLYNSIKEAGPRRDEALKRGIRGAFIVAYYKGLRIPLSSAKKLLKENGTTILQSEMDKEDIIIEVEPINNPVVRTDSVSNENILSVYEEERLTSERIQIVTKKQFTEFPRDVLNRYNAEGAFYYDESDQRVKSVIYRHIDDLPRLYNFKDDIDTLFIPLSEIQQFDTKILSISIEGGTIPGDLMDWLLRFTYQREFKETESGIELRMFGIADENIEEIQSQFRNFALEARIVEESQFELEEND